MYEFLTNDAAASEMIADEGQFLLWSFVVNACHREMFGDHSWFSDDAKDPSSVQHKLLAVAGRFKKAFREWMMKGARAHDGNHHLSTESLAQMASAVAGKSTYAARAAVVGAAGPPIIAPVAAIGDTRYVYAGAPIGEQEVGKLLFGGEACADRYPPGELGKAALIVGLEMLIAMTDSITSRVKVDGTGAFAKNLGAVADSVREESFPYSAVKDVEKALSRLLAISCGYVLEGGLMKSTDNLAFINHSERIPSAMTIGKNLSQTIRDCEVHPEAIQSKVVSLFSDLAGAVATAASVVLIPGTTGPTGAPAVVVAHVDTVDTDKITAKVAETSDDKLEKLLKMVQPSGGTTFYDANP